MRRPQAVRRALPGDDQARRLGLPDHRAWRSSSGSCSSRPACGRWLPCPRACTSPPGTTTVLKVTPVGALDGRALGGSLRVVVTRAADLGAAKTAVDELIDL